MKIILIGNKLESITGDIPDAMGIYDELIKLNHDCFFVHFKNYQEELKNYKEKPDYVFIEKNKNIWAEEIKELKKRFNCPVVYLMQDYISMEEAEKKWKQLAKSVDIWVGKNMTDIGWFKKNNIEHFYWGYDGVIKCFNKIEDKNILKKYPQTPYPDPVPVNFIGNWTHSNFRTRFLYALQKKLPGLIHITTFTVREFREAQHCSDIPGLENVHHPLFGEDFAKIVGQTLINLSIESTQDYGYWSHRIARIMASGGFVMAYYTLGMEKRYYDYVVYFYSVDDCVEKIKYYLNHPQEREVIANKAYWYAHKFLTNKKKIWELLTYLEYYEKKEKNRFLSNNS